MDVRTACSLDSQTKQPPTLVSYFIHSYPLCMYVHVLFVLIEFGLCWCGMISYSKRRLGAGLILRIHHQHHSPEHCWPKFGHVVPFVHLFVPPSLGISWSLWTSSSFFVFARVPRSRAHVEKGSGERHRKKRRKIRSWSRGVTTIFCSGSRVQSTPKIICRTIHLVQSDTFCLLCFKMNVHSILGVQSKHFLTMMRRLSWRRLNTK